MPFANLTTHLFFRLSHLEYSADIGHIVPMKTLPSQHWEQFNSSGYLTPMLNGSPYPFEFDQFLYDSFNPAARKAVFQDWYDGYGKYGIRRLWLDAAEPERFTMFDVGHWRFAMGTDGEIGEAWIQQHVRTFADGMASIGVTPEEYFVLPRHAWAGSWRYSAALWSGDIESTFAELALQVRVVQVGFRGAGRILC